MYNLEKKPFKKAFNKSGALPLLYLGGMTIGAMFYMFAFSFMYTVYYTVSNFETMMYEDDPFYVSNKLIGVIYDRVDLAMIGGAALGVAAVILLCYRWQFRYGLKVKKKTMTAKVLLFAFIGFMALQFFSSITTPLLEKIFNLFGFSITGIYDQISGLSDSWPMIIYIGFIAPVIEEIVFRGALLRSLEKYGKVFAIVISSVLFGVLHGNIPQGIFAALTGLILGYITLEYSLKWAILLHIMNNFLLGQVLGEWIARNPEIPGETIVMYAWFFCFLVILGLIFVKRRRITAYLKLHRSAKHAYRYAFSSWSVIVFILINLGMCILTITRL